MFCVLLPSLCCESNGPNCGKTLFRSEEKLPHSIVHSPNTHNSQPKHICLPVCIANPLEKETAWHIGLKATSAKTMRTQLRSSLFSSDLCFVVIFWWGKKSSTFMFILQQVVYRSPNNIKYYVLEIEELLECSSSYLSSYLHQYDCFL